jgi:hypothetical protein
MRHGAEYEGASLQMGVIVRDESHLPTTKPRALSLSLVGGSEMELERGMLRDEGAQLAAGIARRAEHPDGKFMHGE